MNASRTGLAVALLAAALIAAVGAVQAKYLPFVEEADQDWGGIDDPFILSKARGGVALDGSLSSAGDVDAFRYNFAGPVRRFPLRLDVPVCDGSANADVYPTVALIGPGLPPPEGDLELPFELPDGVGVEAFTLLRSPKRLVTTPDYGPPLYALGLTTWIDIPESGSYTLVVWEPDGHIGPYTVQTGDQEPDFAALTDSEVNALFDKEAGGGWIKASCALISAQPDATAEAAAPPTATP